MGKEAKMIVSRLIQRGLIICVASGFLAGCGQLLRRGGDDDIQRQQFTSLDKLMMNPAEDPSCMNGGSSAVRSKASIWKWDGQSASKQDDKLELLRNTDENFEGAMTSAGVVGAMSGMQTVSECDVDLNTKKIVCKKSVATTEPFMVKFCKDKASYGRDSLESVTATSQYFVSKANEFYGSLAGSSKNILSTIMLMVPQFIKTYHLSDGRVKEIADSNNAAFTTLKTKIGTYGLFVVFPTSKDDFEKSGLHLWEVPFVMSHEYGHNVFAAHMKRVLDATGLTLNNHGSSAHLDLRRKIMPTNAKIYVDEDLGALTVEDEGLALTASDTKAQLALNGVNEMFADLFAFYANGESAGQLKGVECLDVTRDPSSSATKLGAAKQWTSDVNALFNMGGRKVDSCSEPSFDDEHDVAAIMGYQVSHLMSGLYPKDSSKKRMEALLKTLTDLESVVGLNGEDVRLDDLLEAMVRSLVNGKTLTETTTLSAVCADFSKAVAGLPKTAAACK
jgi:hypothetical protein